MCHHSVLIVCMYVCVLVLWCQPRGCLHPFQTSPMCLVLAIPSYVHKSSRGMCARVCVCSYMYVFELVLPVASAVIGLIKSAPDTGLRVTPMIPPWNSLAVGGVATCTVVSPQ